jgi:hypothetical protein
MLVGLVLALAAVALVIGLLSARPGRVSMTLVEYTRWPHGAKLRLTDGTQKTIRYVAERNGTPAGCPILCLQKTSNGWTSASATLRTLSVVNPITRITTEEFFLFDPAAPPKPGDRVASLLTRNLIPGQSVEFWFRLEPGASPKRVGTVCCVPPSELRRKLQPWLDRIEQWCRIKPTPAGQVRVWCPNSLCLPSLQPPATGN